MAKQAGPWIDYLARSSYLLQQGHFSADVACFCGEDSNLTVIYASKAPEVPVGYAFDFIHADALIHELSVVNGKTGMSALSYGFVANASAEGSAITQPN